MQDWKIRMLSGVNGLKGTANLVRLGVLTLKEAQQTNTAASATFIGEGLFLITFLYFSYSNLKDKGFRNINTSNAPCIWACGSNYEGNQNTNSHKIASGIIFLSVVLSIASIILLPGNYSNFGIWCSMLSSLLISTINIVNPDDLNTTQPIEFAISTEDDDPPASPQSLSIT